jgi:type II secretion system protein N
MDDFRELLSLEYWRTHRLESAYVATGLVLFVFFLFATFPYANILSAVLAPMGVRVSSAGQSIAIPIGAKLYNVRISPDAPGARPLFASESVHVAPALLSMLLLQPGIRASADAYQGTIQISAHRSGAGTALNFSARKVNLAGYEALRALGVALGGTLDATGSVVVIPEAPLSDSGTVHLIATGLEGRMKGSMPALKLGTLDASMSLDKGVLRLSSLKTSGGDLAINGSGNIRIAPNLRDSRLALHFTLLPAPTARMKLAFLLGLLPHPPGTRPYTLGGTIGSPTLS